MAVLLAAAATAFATLPAAASATPAATAHAAPTPSVAKNARTGAAFKTYSGRSVSKGAAPRAQSSLAAVNATPVVATLTAQQWDTRTIQATASTDSSQPISLYRFNWGDQQTTDSTTPTVRHTYAKLGTYPVSVTETDDLGNSATATLSQLFATAGSDYTPYGPVRLLDTRYGTGTGGSTATVPAFGSIALTVAGNGGIPQAATAVALNVTVTGPKVAGYLTVYPAGSARPTTTAVNFSPGQTVATMTVSAVGANGKVEFYIGSGGAVSLVADASGYFTPTAADGYQAISPVRALDTRSGAGGYPAKTVSQGRPVVLKIGGQPGVPSGAKAVAVNLTVAGATQSGYISAFPHGQARPLVSNLNFDKGATRANAAVVPVGADGNIEITLTSSGVARVIVDVDGVFLPTGQHGTSYLPITPFRYFDTRKDEPGGLGGFYYQCLPLAQDSNHQPDPAFAGFVISATVTNPQTGGYLSVYPAPTAGCGYQADLPTTSTLNFTGRSTVPNLAFATPGASGDVDVLNGSTGTIQYLVDVYGLFLND
ncbi:MAG: PKD domain-containing protein [Actinocrinis sp.]